MDILQLENEQFRQLDRANKMKISRLQEQVKKGHGRISEKNSPAHDQTLFQKWARCTAAIVTPFLGPDDFKIEFAPNDDKHPDRWSTEERRQKGIMAQLFRQFPRSRPRQDDNAPDDSGDKKSNEMQATLRSDEPTQLFVRTK